MLTANSVATCESRGTIRAWWIQLTPWEVSSAASGTSAAWTAASAPAANTASRLRARHRSHSTSGATRNPAKKCVASASAEKIAHQKMLRLDGSRSARMNQRNDAPANAINSMYDRASCEYQIMNGLSAVNAAAITPARRDTRSLPHR